MEESTKRGKGRPINLKEREVIVDCINRGYGYNRSVPFFIEAGFVDSNGECTITESKFSYTRKNLSNDREFKIKVNAEQYAWAKEHHDEIVAYIQMRMSQDK